MFQDIWSKLDRVCRDLERLLSEASDMPPASVGLRDRVAPSLRRLSRIVANAAREGRRISEKNDLLLDEVTAVLSSTRLGDVLGLTLDALIALTRAERGFLVTVTDEGGLRIEAARHMDRTVIESPADQISTTIVQQAVKKAETICLADAASSERFGSAESVADLGLLSVLAVPLRAKGETLGAVYVESRRAAGVFTEDTAVLVERFADRIAVAILNARMVRDLTRSRDDLQHQLQEKHGFEGFVGQDPDLLESLRIVATAARSDLPILIEGESGTGKELVARAVHYQSERRDGPFVCINCAALPRELLESELFGHVKGAFTGAVADRPGLFAAADRGSIFLDEIGDMDLGLQPKLLRVMQSGEYRRVGSDRTRRADVRLIAATQIDLAAAAGAGRFREDLFYRVNGVRVALPPLRERLADVPLLVEHFLRQEAASRRGDPCELAPDTLACLMRYDFPGNVRELETMIRRAVVFARHGRISPEALPPHVAELASPPAGTALPVPPPRTAEELKEAKKAARAQAASRVERAFLLTALGSTRGNVSDAARTCGINRSQFQQMMARQGVRAADFRTSETGDAGKAS